MSLNCSDKEVSIVQPDMPVRVVLFGFGMDDIALVAFTRSSNNCSMSDIEVAQPDFTIQTEKRVVVKAAFPEFVYTAFAYNISKLSVVVLQLIF